MTGSGSAPTVEEQIAALTAQMTASAEKLQALEAENEKIRAANEELRALVDGVVPDSATSERPALVPNNEPVVDRTAPRIARNLFRSETNPVDHQNQPTPETARVEIDLNHMPARNEATNEPDPAMDQQPDDVNRATTSLPLTPGLVKPGSDLHL